MLRAKILDQVKIKEKSSYSTFVAPSLAKLGIWVVQLTLSSALRQLLHKSSICLQWIAQCGIENLLQIYLGVFGMAQDPPERNIREHTGP